MIVIITKFLFTNDGDTDYQKLDLKIKNYDILYYTTYKEDWLGGKYKVYELKDYSSDSMDEFRSQLETSNLWSRDKYYEYVMQEFYERKDNDKIDKVCRTSDKYKKEHFTDEEATGYEVGVYDSDKHILYYYWESI